MNINELKELVADHYGYTMEKNGDGVYRFYGCSNDEIIELCYEYMMNEKGES